MALDNKKVQEAKRLLSDIEKLYKKIGEVNPFRDVTAANADIDKLKEGLKEAKISADDTASSFSSLAGSIMDSVNELSKQNKYLSQAKSTSNQIAKSAQDALAVRRGETSINEKSIKQAKEKLASQIRILKASRLNLGVFSDQGKEITSVINQLQDYEKGLDGVLKTNEEINKKLGFAPRAVAGLDKALQKAGIPSLGIASALDEVRKNGQAAAAEGKKIGVEFKPGVELTKGIAKNLKSAFSIANIFQGAIGFLVKAIVQGDKATGEMAKSLNITYSEANKVRKELTEIAHNSGDGAVNTRRLQESLTEINKTFGTTGKVSAETLTTFTQLRERAGMTNEEIMGVYNSTVLTGKSMTETVNSFQATAKATSFIAGKSINTKKLMADISKTSKRFQLSTEGGASGLAKAMVNAKLLGVNMAEVENIADSILNFEQSIENELSAELLLGKDISLEKARQAALNNDMATVAAEITKQAGSAAEFGKMNRIQQEALAKAVGMTASGLSDALFEQEAMSKIGRNLTDEEQKAFNSAKDKYGVEQATKMIKDGQLENMVNQQSIAERFQDTMLKVQELFVSMSEPILGLVDGIMNMVGGAENLSTILSSIAGIYTIIKVSQAGFIAGQKISAMLSRKEKKEATQKAVAEISGGAMKSFSYIPVVGAILGAAAAVSGIAMMYSNMSKADDLMSPGGSGGGYGSRTLLGPEGAIQLNNKDTVIAGTNLFDGENKSQSKPQPQQTSTTTSVDMTKTNALLQQLINVIQTGGSVTLDGQKVGEALKLGSFQTQ